MKDNTINHTRKYHLKRRAALMVLSITAMIFLPAVMLYTAEFPDALQKHYYNRQSIYWEIRQVTISPIFDEPETTLVKFYFNKPHSLFIKTANQEVYAIEDTLWTYRPKHKQIQKNIGGRVFNPFDFIDSAQTFYQVVAIDNGRLDLKRVDQSIEPDSLSISFNENGEVKRVEYPDLNENLVIYEILDESFTRQIPADNFLTNTPENIEIIDLNE
ncbi:MAG: hypothetical protein J7K40_05235 [candidate division Zixibacteria bacterium]|nr:hypothetical protein [candidate division Zixibacteria bacterium]